LFAIYFVVDGVGAMPGGLTGLHIPVNLASTDSALIVAQKIQAAILTNMPLYFSASVSQTGGTPTGGNPTYKTTVTAAFPGAMSTVSGIASAASTDFRIDQSIFYTTGSQLQITFSCPDATHLMPGGYFVVFSGGTAYVFYFVVDGVGTAPANPNLAGSSATVAAFPVAVSAIAPTSAIQVAAAVLNALNTNIPGNAFTQLANSPFVQFSSAANLGQFCYNVSSAGLLPDGTYIYQYCFEWTDAQGQKQQSAPSPAYVLNVQGTSPTFVNQTPQNIDPTGHGNDLANPTPTTSPQATGGLIGGTMPRLTLGALRLTAKQNISLVVYRSTVSVGTGAVLYRASSPLTPLIFTNTSSFVSTMQFVDVTSDQLIQKNLPLYTSGSDGLWPGFAAPAPSFCGVHRGRECLISSEYQNQWWFSQPYIPGSGIAPVFNPNLVVPVPADGGNLTGFATMNEKVFFFEQSRIYFSVGDGPGSDVQNSSGGSYSAPDLVTTDTGCTAPGSIILTPLGIMFQGAKGFYLVDPGGNVSNKIGKQVQDLVVGMTCVSAKLMPDRNEVRFAMTGTQGTYTLVFNYFFGMWYLFTGWSGPSEIWNGAYVFYSPLSQGGAGAGVCQETPGIYTDGDGSLVYSLIDMFWAAWAGPQGYQRVRYFTFLGSFGSDHTMLVSVAYNYQPTVGEVIAWNATAACDPSQYGSATYGASVGGGTTGPFGSGNPFGAGGPFGGVPLASGSASVYGDPILGVYQCRGNNGMQLCESIKLTFQDTALPTAGGAGFSLEDLTFNVGVESGTMRLPSGAGGHQAG
jgi:hypothetical protein